MKIICGVDIGNSTTEVTLCEINEITKDIRYLSDYRVKTTGVKGTKDNVIGIRVAISEALKKIDLSINKVDLIKINEASPVIGESAMETISETIITDSAMIGHNPDTPGGYGLALGETIMLQKLVEENLQLTTSECGLNYSEKMGKDSCYQHQAEYLQSSYGEDKSSKYSKCKDDKYKDDNCKDDNYKYKNCEDKNYRTKNYRDKDYKDSHCTDKNYKDKEFIVIVDKAFDYDKASKTINELVKKSVRIKGAILKEDEGVLLNNRLDIKIPIVDEVENIEKIPLGKPAAVEVAEEGKTLKVLCNPYGIAGIFNLNPDETKGITSIAKGLIGLRSAVVIRTPEGEVKKQKIKAGKLKLIGEKSIEYVDINSGAYYIMRKLKEIGNLQDIEGEKATNIYSMINSIKSSMAELSNVDMSKVKIKDLLAIDTTVPLEIKGGIARETYNEKAVAIAAMVKTNKLPLIEIKEELENYFKVKVEINGVEAVMASIGALTTKGTKLPIAVVDIGGGSTDIALLNEDGKVKTVHLAGAGELVTMLINLELNLNDRSIAEEVKKNIVGKVESLYTIRLETGEVRFYQKPLSSKLYGRIVIVKDKDLIPIYENTTLERVVKVRRKAKEQVFIKNIIRGLKIVSDMENIHVIPNVVLVGGSALDFEVPDMVSLELSNYGIIAGCGNIRKTEGPRHAVSTGLVLHYIERL